MLRPLADAPADAAPDLPAEERRGDAAAVEASARHGHVLIADADTLTASLLRHRLERDGWPVTVVDDGEAALDVLARVPTALAVLSIRLPGIGGFELLRRIRTFDPPQPTVLLLSYSSNERDLVRAFDLGADDYLLKPVSPLEFLARARRLLRFSGFG